MQYTTVVSTSSFGANDRTPLEMLEKTGMKIVLNPHGRQMTESEIKTLLKDADYLVAGTEPLTKDVLSAAPKLKVISRCGTGLDNVDLSAADELKISVFNTPDAPTGSVAELTVGLILSLLRGISASDSKIRQGLWKKNMGTLVGGKTVGVIGMGRIGRRVAEILSVMGANIVFCDVRKISGLSGWVQMEMEELLRKADLITLHSAGLGKGKYLIGNGELAKTKKGVFVVNAARGGLVDEKSLFEYLRSGHVAGAALDVFEKEPYSGPFTELENVVLTPHVGSYAKETRKYMEIEAVQNVLAYIEKNKPV